MNKLESLLKDRTRLIDENRILQAEVDRLAEENKTLTRIIEKERENN